MDGRTPPLKWYIVARFVKTVLKTHVVDSDEDVAKMFLVLKSVLSDVSFEGFDEPSSFRSPVRFETLNRRETHEEISQRRIVGRLARCDKYITQMKVKQGG